ncbi:unnamed protein product [Ilex paraguariensis]|uniref:Smr domain-containing protein n=1 Tax=Ilex paraguariensis TaxID=185542 RepID=A0ABC8R8V6_9AQUA
MSAKYNLGRCSKIWSEIELLCWLPSLCLTISTANSTSDILEHGHSLLEHWHLDEAGANFDTCSFLLCICDLLHNDVGEFLWDEANGLLDEMFTNRVSNIHQVIGQMIKGDYDDISNWQMVEYVLDKLNSEGCGLGMRCYNTLLDALWWLGQKKQAAVVLIEATKRGIFPELFCISKLVWPVDVHRMWPGGACTATSVWLNNMQEMLINGEDLPQMATVVVVRGQMETSSMTRDFPVAKAAYSFLKDNVSSSFCFPGWNKGRIVCQRSQLKKILSGTESSSDGSKKDHICTLNNSHIPLPETRTSMGDAKRGQYGNADTETSRTSTELATSTVEAKNYTSE